MDSDPTPACPTCLQPMTEVAGDVGSHESPATDAVVLDTTWRCGDPDCPGSAREPVTPGDHADGSRDAPHDEERARANRPTGADDVGA